MYGILIICNNRPYIFIPSWKIKLHQTTEPSMLTLIHNPCRKKKFPDENLLLIETVFYLGREYIKFNEDSLIITRFRGAMVARLTPDQEVACSSHVGIINRTNQSFIRSILGCFWPCCLMEIQMVL